VKIIHFDREDLDLFSAASHDRNPLHLSEAYARKTVHGEPVVFGILAALAALGGQVERREQPLRSAVLTFRKPLYVGLDYRAIADVKKAGQMRVAIEDGGRPQLTATFTFEHPADRAAVGEFTGTAPLVEPVCQGPEDLQEGVTVGGENAPSPTLFGKLFDGWNLSATVETAPRLAALLWSSYLVGMQLPGERGTFSRLELRFRESLPPLSFPLAYQARITSFDERFHLLQISANLFCGGVSIADAEISSFVRYDSPPLRLGAIAEPLPRSETLKGRTALVIGGSRGLGAAIVAALVSQGCHVVVVFRRSRDEAEALAARLHDAGGTISLVQGDASDVAWCRSLLGAPEVQGGLDLLVCSAIPPIHTLAFAPDCLGRIRKYVDDSLALVAAPAATFLDLLESREGRLVVISSSVAPETMATFPQDWHHYVAAKAAVEGMIRSIAAQSRRAHFLVARPSRLLTALSNTPLGHQGAIAVEGVAAAIVKRLCAPSTPAQVEIIDQF